MSLHTNTLEGRSDAESGISDDEKIKQFFSHDSNHTHILKSDVIDTLKFRVRPNFLTRIISFLFPESCDKVSFEVFSRLYSNLVVSDFRVRALTVAKLVNVLNNENIQPFEKIPKQEVINYVRDVISSYLSLLLYFKMKEPRQWLKIGATNSLLDVDEVVTYLLKGMESHQEQVTIGYIESWLYKCTLFTDISDELYKSIYGVLNEWNLKTLVSLPMTRELTTTVLTLPQVLLLNSTIPNPSFEWSSVFNGTSASETWESFLAAVTGKRNTLLVVATGNEEVIGFYAHNEWAQNESFYGSNESFIFTLKPEVNVYFPTGRNANFQFLNGKVLGMGGTEGEFGLSIESLKLGRTSLTCPTFREFWPVASEFEFAIDKLEVWTTYSDSAQQRSVVLSPAFVNYPSGEPRYALFVPKGSRSVHSCPSQAKTAVTRVIRSYECVKSIQVMKEGLAEWRPTRSVFQAMTEVDTETESDNKDLPCTCNCSCRKIARLVATEPFSSSQLLMKYNPEDAVHQRTEQHVSIADLPSPPSNEDSQKIPATCCGSCCCSKMQLKLSKTARKCCCLRAPNPSVPLKAPSTMSQYPKKPVITPKPSANSMNDPQVPPRIICCRNPFCPKKNLRIKVAKNPHCSLKKYCRCKEVALKRHERRPNYCQANTPSSMSEEGEQKWQRNEENVDCTSRICPLPQKVLQGDGSVAPNAEQSNVEPAEPPTNPKATVSTESESSTTYEEPPKDNDSEMIEKLERNVNLSDIHQSLPDIPSISPVIEVDRQWEESNAQSIDDNKDRETQLGPTPSSMHIGFGPTKPFKCPNSPPKPSIRSDSSTILLKRTGEGQMKFSLEPVAEEDIIWEEDKKSPETQKASVQTESVVSDKSKNCNIIISVVPWECAKCPDCKAKEAREGPMCVTCGRALKKVPLHRSPTPRSFTYTSNVSPVLRNESLSTESPATLLEISLGSILKRDPTPVSSSSQTKETSPGTQQDAGGQGRTTSADNSLASTIRGTNVLSSEMSFTSIFKRDDSLSSEPLRRPLLQEDKVYTHAQGAKVDVLCKCQGSQPQPSQASDLPRCECQGFNCTIYKEMIQSLIRPGFCYCNCREFPESTKPNEVEQKPPQPSKTHQAASIYTMHGRNLVRQVSADNIFSAKGQTGNLNEEEGVQGDDRVPTFIHMTPPGIVASRAPIQSIDGSEGSKNDHEHAKKIVFSPNVEAVSPISTAVSPSSFQNIIETGRCDEPDMELATHIAGILAKNLDSKNVTIAINREKCEESEPSKSAKSGSSFDSQTTVEIYEDVIDKDNSDATAPPLSKRDDATSAYHSDPGSGCPSVENLTLEDLNEMVEPINYYSRLSPIEEEPAPRRPKRKKCNCGLLTDSLFPEFNEESTNHVTQSGKPKKKNCSCSPLKNLFPRL